MDNDPMDLDARRSERYQRCKARYTKDRKIGEGTYAVVYLGTDRQTNRPIAIKKIKMASTAGLDISAIRELKLCRSFKHENLCELLDVFSSKSNLQLVLAYYPFDLERIIKEKKVMFTMADVKAWMCMVLRGVTVLHDRWWMHRDLKPNNLLVGDDGIIRIGDFGLARDVALPLVNDNSALMTSQVVTRWYRAPELLLGARQYGPSVDMWSVGCIMAELLLRTPFFPGDSDINQLAVICRALGTPSESDWPGLTQLPDYHPLTPVHPPTPFEVIFPAASADALDLMKRLLRWDPNKRLAAREALDHSFFKNQPSPTPPNLLPKPSPSTPSNPSVDPKRLFID